VDKAEVLNVFSFAPAFALIIDTRASPNRTANTQTGQFTAFAIILDIPMDASTFQNAHWRSAQKTLQVLKRIVVSKVLAVLNDVVTDNFTALFSLFSFPQSVKPPRMI